MTKNLQLLKIAFVIFGVVALVYGILFLLVPDVLVRLAGSVPVPAEWLRWPGGILIALGIGSFLALKNPSKQETFVFTLALATLLCGLALLYTLLFENVASIWFSVTPVILNLVISVLFWISWRKLTKQEEK